MVWWASPNKEERSVSKVFHLISLSEIKSLCVSASSSAAGEIKKDVSRRAAEITERSKSLVGFSQKEEQFVSYGLSFDFPLRNQIPLRLCVLERSGRDKKYLSQSRRDHRESKLRWAGTEFLPDRRHCPWALLFESPVFG